MRKGHDVKACIFEVFGGFDASVVALLNDWAGRARGKTPPGEEPPWCARNYVPYWSQLISAAAQRGAAEEILWRTREEATARDTRAPTTRLVLHTSCSSVHDERIAAAAALAFDFDATTPAGLLASRQLRLPTTPPCARATT